MPYYSNIANQELQYFHNLKVKNFTIKLSDVLTSGLFKVDEIITNSIYKIYPLFYTNEITSSNSEDKILDNKCLICTKTDKETYITFIRNSDEEIVDYNNYASYYDIDDNLTTNQFNAYVSLIRHNTIHNDSIRIADNVNGAYGNYEFDLDGCTILDNGIVITDETITAQPQVRLTGNVFHYSTYTLKLSILHYTGVNILDDITPTDFIIVDTLEIELTPYQWIPIPISNIENGYIIDFDTVIEIKHDKPIIPDWIQSIDITGEPSIIQTGENAEIYATGLDNGGVPVGEGHTLHFFEKLEPSLTVSAVPQIIQTGEDMEIYSKVKDSDGSLAQNVKVHFYQVEEEPVPVPSTLTVVSDKDILSYNDGDKAVLTATVLDEDDNPLANENVIFKIGSSVLDTVMTDDSGVAEYEYTSQGSGDVVVSVECSNLQETYSIEDCYFYDSQTVDKSRYTVTKGGANISYSSNGVTIAGTQATDCIVKNTALSLPNSYSAEVITTAMNGDTSSRTFYGGLVFDDCLLDFSSTFINIYRFSTTSQIFSINQGLHINDVIKIEMDNGTMKIYINDVLKTTQSITHTGEYYNRTYKANGATPRSLTTKDLKVKPL